MGPSAAWCRGHWEARAVQKMRAAWWWNRKGEKRGLWPFKPQTRWFRQRVQVLSYHYQSGLVQPWTSQVEADMLTSLNFPFLLCKMKIASSWPTPRRVVGMECESSWRSATPRVVPAPSWVLSRGTRPPPQDARQLRAEAECGSQTDERKCRLVLIFMLKSCNLGNMKEEQSWALSGNI